MILKINCGLFLAAMFGLVYQAEPVSSYPTFLNDTQSGWLLPREGETIELPCNYKGSYKKKDYPDEIEITWKKIEGSKANLNGIDLKGSNETILAVGDKIHEDITRFSVELKKSKSRKIEKCKAWEPFWSYQLNSTAHSAHLPQNWAK